MAGLLHVRATTTTVYGKAEKRKREEGGWRIEAVRKRKMDVETIFTTFDESEGARRASLPPRHIAEANVI
jgi:hypothetical protein